MRTAALLLLALAAPALAQVPPPGAPAADSLVAPPPDAWFGNDKAKHAGLSFALAAGGGLALRHGMDARRGDAVAFAAGVTLALGVTKEVADARRPRSPLFSWRDLVADAVGAALGAVVASL